MGEVRSSQFTDEETEAWGSNDVFITAQPSVAELGWNQACLTPMTRATDKMQTKQDAEILPSYALMLPDYRCDCRILSFPFFFVFLAFSIQSE